MNEDTRLSVAFGQLHLALCMVKNPVGNERPVAHVVFLNVSARRYAAQLGHKTVEHVGIIMCLVSIGRWQKSKLHHLRIGHVIESEQVGTRLLNGAAIRLKRV